jgi:hypothetical protein
VTAVIARACSRSLLRKILQRNEQVGTRTSFPAPVGSEIPTLKEPKKFLGQIPALLLENANPRTPVRSSRKAEIRGAVAFVEGATNLLGV